ncbi:SDR family NAD(P)-dependent oxidoreductase [Pollutibacter soli]|uniref:SDR family NAD(P)-dependent oxidoreductase n=1 Tax=Pollutibacter soli TaxID=3034157 RepID=UPI0030134163
MELNFQNKVVLVTGAAGGIGSCLIEEFTRTGARIYGTDIIAGPSENYFQGDITDVTFLRSMVERIINMEGGIDVLVNSAGICLRTPLKDITRKEWELLMDINLTSVFLLTQLVVENMKTQGSGTIVSLASVAGKVGGIIAGTHYAVSKAGIECFTKSAAKIYAPYGITVNAVAPGIIDTSMQDDVPADQMSSVLRSIPMQRAGTAKEVAATVMFLASGLASYITGQTICVNGGNYM